MKVISTKILTKHNSFNKIDDLTGTSALGNLISQMGLPSFAGMVLLGMIFGD